MKERKDTRIHLVAELEKLRRTPTLDTIIELAKAGEFHDFKNKQFACGKVAAVDFLQAEAIMHPDQSAARTLVDLANRVMQGEFDEEADQEDIEEMRKLVSPSMWAALGLEKKD